MRTPKFLQSGDEGPSMGKGLSLLIIGLYVYYIVTGDISKDTLVEAFKLTLGYVLLGKGVFAFADAYKCAHTDHTEEADVDESVSRR